MDFSNILLLRSKLSAPTDPFGSATRYRCAIGGRLCPMRRMPHNYKVAPLRKEVCSL